MCGPVGDPSIDAECTVAGWEVNSKAELGWRRGTEVSSMGGEGQHVAEVASCLHPHCPNTWKSVSSKWASSQALMECEQAIAFLSFLLTLP
jgi:hypothetical protein